MEQYLDKTGLTYLWSLLKLNFNLIQNSIEHILDQIDSSVGIQWNVEDSLKTVTYIGNQSLKLTLIDWIDNSGRPCEVKKDYTDFAYLTNTTGVASSTNWLKRADGTDSHYDSLDKEDYLLMVELENINVKIKQDKKGNVYAVLFNFDAECPYGFKRWLIEDTKLFARYDSTNNSTAGHDICLGKNYTGNNSAENIFTRNAATGSGIMEITAWEYAVFAWLMVFRYGIFDIQTALGRGIESGSLTSVETFTNGITDSLTTSCGKVTTTGGLAIRFMYIENLYGLRWIFTVGWRGELTIGYFTYDDQKANATALMSISDADETHSIIALSTTYSKNVNKLGLCTETGGSSSSGCYDGNWSNINASSRIMYCGGTSGDGTLDGPFARTVYHVVSTSRWGHRGRGALRKSVVVPAV